MRQFTMRVFVAGLLLMVSLGARCEVVTATVDGLKYDLDTEKGTATVVGLAISIIGLANLPTAETPYTDGMNWVVIILFCVIPMIAWALTLIAMKGYSLTGERMKEIQAVNAKRKELIAGGMTLEEAMQQCPGKE